MNEPFLNGSFTERIVFKNNLHNKYLMNSFNSSVFQRIKKQYNPPKRRIKVLHYLKRNIKALSENAASAESIFAYMLSATKAGRSATLAVVLVNTHTQPGNKGDKAPGPIVVRER